MAYPGAEVVPWRSRLARPIGRGYRRAVAALEDYPLERIGLAAIAAGLVLRIAATIAMDFRSDGHTYTAMAHAWALRGEFLMPYGDVTTWVRTDAMYSNHYPPAYPFYLGVVFKVFGFGRTQAELAALAMSVAALLVCYVCTRDLYGKTAAALVAGVLALEPHLLWVTGTGFSENMVLLFFAATMWAILKSLEDERYIVLAGLFAGLAYLSRSSVGYFFFIAGVGGFLWRFYHKRWKLFTNVWYMAAIAIFGTIVLLWAWRNVALFGWERESFTVLGWSFTLETPKWETSSYIHYVQNLAWEKDADWRHALWMKLPFFLGMLAWLAIPFWPEIARAGRRIKEEETSALWLSVVLVWVIAWVITSMFWVFERSFMYWLDNHRYVIIGILPLMWLVVREMRPERASTRLRYALVLLSLLAACAGTLASPVRFADLRAAEAMDPYLEPGDEIGIDGGTIKYAFYGYLSEPEKMTVYGCSTPSTPPTCVKDREPEWILTLKEGERYGENFTKVGTFRQGFWNGGVMTAILYARDDVVAARGVPDTLGYRDCPGGIGPPWCYE